MGLMINKFIFWKESTHIYIRCGKCDKAVFGYTDRFVFINHISTGALIAAMEGHICTDIPAKDQEVYEYEGSEQRGPFTLDGTKDPEAIKEDSDNPFKLQ